MKKERLFRVIGMIEDDLIKEAEDEPILYKKSFHTTPIFKWTAAVAGIILIIGAKVFYESLNKNDNSMISFNGSGYIETTAAEVENYEWDKNIDDKDDKSEVTAETMMTATTSSDGVEESNTIDLKESLEEESNGDNKVVLYAEVIEEIYQAYKGEILYLNLENSINLEKEQKEILLEVLDTEYQIPVITGRFEELCKQGIIDAQAEEIVGIYLSFEVTAEEENGFQFQIDCWKGKNMVFGWKDCYAWYQNNRWSYNLGEE